MKLIYLFDSSSVPLSVLKINLKNQLKVFRFTSIKDIRNVYHLGYLHPYQSVGSGGIGLAIPPDSENSFLNELSFDNWYASYLVENNFAFLDIMQIMSALYNGNDVCILVGNDDNYEYKSVINDSLAKYIQQIYGWNTNIINSISDLDTLEDGDFSIPGIMKFENDLDRFLISKVSDMEHWDGDLDGII